MLLINLNYVISEPRVSVNTYLEIYLDGFTTKHCNYNFLVQKTIFFNVALYTCA